MTDRESPTPSLTERAREILAGAWTRISAGTGPGVLPATISDELRQDIHAAVNSRIKSYRYVLPTQLVSKIAAPELDCRCLQASRGGAGAFDARTIAHEVVVPFDQENHGVLGGSPEPYVNNPLRVPEVSQAYREAQKNKMDWDALCRVLDAVENGPGAAFTQSILSQVLFEIRQRLADVRVVYPTPRRISLDAAISISSHFLETRSGGDRLLALTGALFAVIGRRFKLYSAVRRAGITAADAAAGLLADLECVTEEEEIAIVVEVKDRQLTITQLRSKMRDIRQKEVSEIFFVAQQGIAESDGTAVRDQIQSEFVSGHNVYVTDFPTLARTILSLFGESGRREFLREVGEQLDHYGSDITHRQAWAALLSTV